MEFYKGNIPIYDPQTPQGRDGLFPRNQARGGVPRDYKVHPKEMFQPPSELALIPESEWDARWEEQERLRSSLEHVYLSGSDGGPAFTNLDQDGDGYCWAYSTGQATMIDRLARGMRHVRLNPHSVAAIIKGGRNEGGWCGLSAKMLREVGIAPEGTGPGQWPLHSRKLSNDTPAMRAAMANYRTLEDWVDLARSEYDQNLTKQQAVSCGFVNIPMAHDFNPWSHSVCCLRWVRVERGSWQPLILNSWLGWGRFGLGVVRWNPDGALAIRQTVPS